MTRQRFNEKFADMMAYAISDPCLRLSILCNMLDRIDPGNPQAYRGLTYLRDTGGIKNHMVWPETATPDGTDVVLDGLCREVSNVLHTLAIQDHEGNEA